MQICRGRGGAEEVATASLGNLISKIIACKAL